MTDFEREFPSLCFALATGVFPGGGEAVGTVREVEGTAGGARLVIDAARGEIQVPLAAEICTTIDPVAKRIVIDPPAGLLDLNEQKV